MTSTPRRGVAMIWMLIVLAALTALFGTITWQHLAGRRVLEQRHKQLQAEWLAQAGVELAAARLLNDPTGYRGETVTLLPGGEVRITVQFVDEVFCVTSEARYRTDEPPIVMRSITRRFRRRSDPKGVYLELDTAPGPTPRK
jgi:hypothetical protein